MFSIVFTPVFGKEHRISDHHHELMQPDVFLLFWGSYWQSAVSPQAQMIETAATELVNSDFFAETAQYKTGGNVNLGGAGTAFGYDASDPISGSFGPVQLTSLIEQNISTGVLPASFQLSGPPIYVVVTPPGIKSNSAIDAGRNFEENGLVGAWVETVQNSSGALLPDTTSTVLSHEIAEAMTDPGNTGYEVRPSARYHEADLHNGNQIGDFEPHYYRFREPDGVLVQPLWSQKAGAFVVDDGTSVNFRMSPIWKGSAKSEQFTGTYDLILAGDQKIPGERDTITVDTSAAGGVQATIDGQTADFDKGTIAEILIRPGGGPNVIDVFNTQVPIKIQSSGFDLVTIGDPVVAGKTATTSGIQAKISVDNPDQLTELIVDDSADAVSSAIQLDGGALSGLAPSEIDFVPGQIRQLQLKGNAGDVITVKRNPFGTSVALNGKPVPKS